MSLNGTACIVGAYEHPTRRADALSVVRLHADVAKGALADAGRQSLCVLSTRAEIADLQHYGAGETVCKPMLAAVANAIFDATGVRMRRVPFTTARVLAALKA